MGPQPKAKAAFARAGQEQVKFRGWEMGGWVRWLEGLRGAYERRMVRMCRILDAGTHLIRADVCDDALDEGIDSDWGIVTKTKLINYRWPRGGMFVWLRVNFERHPLWQAAGSHGQLIDGTTLSTALHLFLTTKPYLVIVATGVMFSATKEIRAEIGWAYFRLCFAAETEDSVDASTRRFVDGLHDFWRIMDVKKIEKLADSFPSAAGADNAADSAGRLGTWLGTWLGC